MIEACIDDRVERARMAYASALVDIIVLLWSQVGCLSCCATMTRCERQFVCCRSRKSPSRTSRGNDGRQYGRCTVVRRPAWRGVIATKNTALDLLDQVHPLLLFLAAAVNAPFGSANFEAVTIHMSCNNSHALNTTAPYIFVGLPVPFIEQ